MKKYLIISLIALLVLPTFIPWMPHGIVHALHDRQEIQKHGHVHSVHDHDEQTQVSARAHHHIYIDVVTYFSDYLYVDLRSPDQIALTALFHDSQDIDYSLDVNTVLQQRHELPLLQSRAPPDRLGTRTYNIPLYLSTQRLRV